MLSILHLPCFSMYGILKLEARKSTWMIDDCCMAELPHTCVHDRAQSPLWSAQRERVRTRKEDQRSGALPQRSPGSVEALYTPVAGDQDDGVYHARDPGPQG